MRTILLTAILVAALSCLQAADKAPPKPPRVKANSNRTTSGDDFETYDRSFPSGSPRAMQNAASRKSTKGSTTNTLNRALTGMDAKARDTKPSRTRNTKPEE